MRFLDYVAAHPGACVTLALATVAAASATITAVMLHSERHVTAELEIKVARDERIQFRESIRSLDEKQDQTLRMLASIKKAVE